MAWHLLHLSLDPLFDQSTIIKIVSEKLRLNDKWGYNITISRHLLVYLWFAFVHLIPGPSYGHLIGRNVIIPTSGRNNWGSTNICLLFRRNGTLLSDYTLMWPLEYPETRNCQAQSPRRQKYQEKMSHTVDTVACGKSRTKGCVQSDSLTQVTG